MPNLYNNHKPHITMSITKARKEKQEAIIREYYDSPVRFDGVVTTRRKHIGGFFCI